MCAKRACPVADCELRHSRVYFFCSMKYDPDPDMVKQVKVLLTAIRAILVEGEEKVLAKDDEWQDKLFLDEMADNPHVAFVTVNVSFNIYDER